MMDLEEAKKILGALEAEGVEYVLVGSVAIRAEDLAGDYPAVEYTPPHVLYSMDILSRLGEAFRYESLEWEEVALEGVRVRVATPLTLYRMKKDTVRLRDRWDAEALRERFNIEESD